MRAWWASLNLRERRFLLGGGAAIVLAGGYLFVLEPLQTQRAHLIQQVTAEAQVLSELDALAAEAERLRGASGARGALPAGQTLLGVLNETAAASALQNRIKRVVPASDSDASVALDDVAFDALVAWLIELRQHYGVEVSRLVVDKTQTTGNVNATINLQALR